MKTSKRDLWQSPGLSRVDREQLGMLLAQHRNALGVADYDSSPSMHAIFQHVEKLMFREAEDAIIALSKEAGIELETQQLPAPTSKSKAPTSISNARSKKATNTVQGRVARSRK